ncbi:hypothetical protein Droror1_Dr00002005 [Drosera rotundifolia]
MEWKPLPEAAVPQFKEGINLLLSSWPALRMAVENDWGGPHSRDIANQLAVDVFDWFAISRGEPLYIDDLENLLDEKMLSLNTEAEDGSVQETAERLLIMFEECLDRSFGSIQLLRESWNLGIPAHFAEQVEDSDRDIDDVAPSDMIVDTPESLPMPIRVQEVKSDPKPELMDDEDGFRKVTYKKNRGRKKQNQL